MALLARVGVDPSIAKVIASGTPDDEAVALVRRARPDLLVVPFHAHHDRSGRPVNGLDLVRLLRVSAAPKAPIVCPVSRAGLAAWGLMESRLGSDVLGHTLVLPEGEIDQLEEGLREFLGHRQMLA